SDPDEQGRPRARRVRLNALREFDGAAGPRTPIPFEGSAFSSRFARAARAELNWARACPRAGTLFTAVFRRVRRVPDRLALSGSASARARALGELSLQGAAVQAEQGGGLGDVAAAAHEDAIDVLPLDAIERWHGGGGRFVGGGAVVVEGGDELVDVRGLGEGVNGARADRVEGRRDAAVAGQDHDARRRIELVELAHRVEAREARHSEIDDGALRGLALGVTNRFLGGRHAGCLEAAR